MKSRNLVVMLLLVAAAAAALYFTQGEDEGPPARNPLRDVDFSSLSSISVRRADGGSWTMRRTEAGDWRLRSPQLSGGVELPAATEARQRLMGGLRDCEPRTSVRLDAATLKAQDLADPELRVTLVDANGTMEIEIGKPHVDDLVAFRRKGDDVAFRVHYGVFDDLARDVAWYRDPRLVEFDFGDLQTLEVERNGRTTRLERLGGRWTVRGPDGVSRNGEQTNCDRFAAGVLSLSAGPLDPARAGEIPRETPHTRFTIRTVDGRTGGYDVLAVDDARKEIVASRADDPELRLGGRDAWRVLTQDLDELASRKLLEVEEHEITALEIERGDRLPTLKLKHWNRTAWYLEAADVRADPKVDQARFEVFRDRLLNLRHRADPEGEGSFPAHWLVRVHFDEATGSPPLEVRLSAPGPDGSSRVARSDGGGGLRTEPGDLDFLDQRWWDLAQRFVASSREDQIAEITLLDGREKDGTFRLEIGISEDGERNEWHLGERTVPDDFVRPLLAKLSFLGVEDYVGLAADHPDLLTEEPRFAVAWRIPVAASAGPVVEWTTWKVLKRLDDERWACSIDSFPGLLFSIRGEELLPIENALRGVRRS